MDVCTGLVHRVPHERLGRCLCSPEDVAGFLGILDVDFGCDLEVALGAVGEIAGADDCTVVVADELGVADACTAALRAGSSEERNASLFESIEHIVLCAGGVAVRLATVGDDLDVDMASLGFEQEVSNAVQVEGETDDVDVLACLRAANQLLPAHKRFGRSHETSDRADCPRTITEVLEFMLSLAKLLLEVGDSGLMPVPLVAHSLLCPDGALASILQGSLVVRRACLLSRAVGLQGKQGMFLSRWIWRGR